MDDPSQRIR